MVTDRDLERALQDRDFSEEASLTETGRSEPAFGPSDSSDSGSDIAPNMPDTDSDRENTGERPQAENTGEEPLDDDIEPDRIVQEDDAGLARTPPDPVRNGGVDED
ncbi:MatE family transporter [Pollutimonas nitritireducens]|uniref:MatE family transporter n=1 Tax=Pollutimonas nitritireducens TaxID=2045209 RepID=UPI001E2FF89A|nr:MatE family transporter [Pollutimonas nitritireducens]